MFGEVAVHVLPDAAKTGLFEHADVVVFVRYDDVNTQHRVPAGGVRDERGQQKEWTFGLSVYPIPNLVLKADYQIYDDKTTRHYADKLNFGVGWQF